MSPNIIVNTMSNIMSNIISSIISVTSDWAAVVLCGSMKDSEASNSGLISGPFIMDHLGCGQCDVDIGVSDFGCRLTQYGASLVTGPL